MHAHWMEPRPVSVRVSLAAVVGKYFRRGIVLKESDSSGKVKVSDLCPTDVKTITDYGFVHIVPRRNESDELGGDTHIALAMALAAADDIASPDQCAGPSSSVGSSATAPPAPVVATQIFSLPTNIPPGLLPTDDVQSLFQSSNNCLVTSLQTVEQQLTAIQAVPLALPGPVLGSSLPPPASSSVTDSLAVGAIASASLPHRAAPPILNVRTAAFGLLPDPQDALLRDGLADVYSNALGTDDAAPPSASQQ